jgi:C1A family cysteine protease
MMFGQEFVQPLSDIQKYVVKYGQPEVVPYFTAIHWQENEDGTIVLTRIQFIADREEPNKFIDLLENRYTDASEVCTFKPDESDKIIAYFKRLYQSKINLEYAGVVAELNICLHVPLSHADIWQQASRFIAHVTATQLPFVLDVVGLNADLENLFFPEMCMDKKTEQGARDILSEIVELRKTTPKISHLIVVSNYQRRGFSLDFTNKLFTAFLSELGLLYIENYEGNEKGLFKAVPYESDLVAIGFSTLQFDPFYFVNYLLHKSYLYVMREEGITDGNEMDTAPIKWVLHKTRDILKDKINLFSSFYQTEIQSRLDNKLAPDIISREVELILGNKITRVEQECESFLQETLLYDTRFTLPLKRAVFSALLDKNDELLKGTLFSEETWMLEDLNVEAIDVFVEANNSLLSRDETKDDALLSSDHDRIESPWGTIKKLRVESLQLNAEIHTLEEDIERLSKKIEHREEVGQEYIKQDGWIDESGNFYHLLPDVELKPLDAEYYKAHAVKNSGVDLRDGFTEIKSQGQQGSCTAHAVLSIFEYILKSNRAEKTDLSESFLYYNARMLAGSDSAYKDEGSSIYYNIMSLGKYGICSEEACPYHPDLLLTPDNPPGEHAYEEAKSRRVEKALNLNMNVEDIKSALEDGFPVQFGTKLYDSFGNSYRGVVAMPTKEEMEYAVKDNRNRRHAMVICGYDDHEQLFIVRNSWGTHFGDQGYCYLPYAYITDTSLTDKLGYIITEVTVYKAHGIVKRKGINFDANDIRLQISLLMNRLVHKKHVLETNIGLLAAFNSAYEELKNNIIDYPIYTSLKKATKKRLTLDIEALQQAWQTTERCKQEELSAFRKKTVRATVSVAVILLSLCLGCFIFAWNILGIAIMVCGISGVATYWLHRNRMYKNLEDAWVEKCDAVFREKASKITELNNSDLRMDTAHQIVARYKTLKMNLDDKYTFLVAFIDYLERLYQKQVDALKGISPEDRVPFISLIHNRKLDAYFDENRDKITRNISLSDIFNQQNMNRESSVNEMIDTCEQKIKQVFVAELKSIMQDFNVCMHLSEPGHFPYLEEVDFDKAITSLSHRSEVFLQHTKAPAASEIVFINTPHGEALHGKKRFVKPVQTILSPYKAICVQVEELSLRDIAHGDMDYADNLKTK